MSRPRIRRTSEHQFRLYSTNTTLGWSVFRLIGYSEGERGVLRGSLRRVLDMLGNHVGYQPVNAAKPTDEGMPSRGSSVTISVREVELNAGLLGQSRTDDLNEEERINRRDKFGHQLMPEDAVELARAKVRLWPEIGGFQDLVVVKC